MVEKITIPFLICHGSNDRQIPVEYAHRSYEQAVATPKRQLRIFTPTRAAPSTSGSTIFRTSATSSPIGSPTNSLAKAAIAEAAAAV
ncbi:fermentation-respiration switch protein FrsA (DUF1100 family) [Mycobacterium sp. OAE908]|uniref:alpha/beta hydrolase family protein n=1 Tax=Mycobacterium sp. OAE908 TaxID=2817899 RepID=UPI0034E19C36